jgi:hypothetical protein
MVVPSGQMRVVGGLITHDLSSESDGIPFFSQIPYLGAFFGKKSKTDKLSNLMFFITPTILETEPLNDVIVEPVNAEAKLAMLHAEKQMAKSPMEPNAIPAALKPYLEQIRPRSIAYPDTAGDMATSATMSEAALTSVTLASEAALKAGRSILKIEPPAVLLTEHGDVVKVGGANADKPGKVGPTVAFGVTGGKSAASRGSKRKTPASSTARKSNPSRGATASRSKSTSMGSSLTPPPTETHY